MDKKSLLFKHIFRTFFGLSAVILLAICIRLFLVEIYLIPSQSMSPTIIPGDVVLVSKINYGPRLSGFTNGSRDYLRLGDVSGLKRYDSVVFNYPMGDSVLSKHSHNDYYKMKAKAKYDLKNDTLLFRPIKYRQPYIKRCIGLPGDTMMLKGGQPYVNDAKTVSPVDNSTDTSTWVLKRGNRWRKHPRTPERASFWRDAEAYRIIFPNNNVYMWNHEIFGPVMVPKKGATIKLDLVNIWLYKRVIEAYEHNTVSVSAEGIFINGTKTTSYTFKMNYYFMMGDNRGNSIDSVYWGFVPEDHIIGKALCIVFSKDNDRINWSRMFKGLK